MQSLRQIGAGFLLGIVSVVIVLGGFALAMAEGGLVPAAASASPTASNPTSIIVTILPTLPLPINTLAPTGTETPGPTLTATVSPTPPPTQMLCPPPAGWIVIVVQPNDTLASLSQVYRTSVELLRTKNCLISDQLVSGSILYVPPLPTSTAVPCGAPANWGRYTVVAGDTLYRISLLYRVTVSQLMRANCLYTTNISPGQVLRVPNVPTSTPPVTVNTPFPTSTEAPTLSPTPVPTTEVPPPTITPTETILATEIPTETSTPVTPASP